MKTTQKDVIDNIAYDTTTGKAAKTPNLQDLQENIISGKLAFKKNTDIDVISPEGLSGKIPAANIQEALQNGYRLESSHESAVRQYLKENKGLSGDAKAGISSFGNEALFGIPEIVFEHTGSELEKDKYKALLKEHDTASKIGSISGFGASLFVGGPLFKGAAKGGQLAGRAIAGTGARAVERAAAETATAAALSSVENKLILSGVEKAIAKEAAPSLIRRTAAEAARLGVEGAIISSPQALTEAIFGDYNKSAEHLLAGIGANVALGGLMNGAGLLGKQFSSLTKKVANESSFGNIIKDEISTYASPELAAMKAAGIERGTFRKIGEDKAVEYGKTLLTQPMKDGLPVVNRGMSLKELKNRVNIFRKESVEEMDSILTKLDEKKHFEYLKGNKLEAFSKLDDADRREIEDLFNTGQFKSATDKLLNSIKSSIEVLEQPAYGKPSYGAIESKLKEMMQKYDSPMWSKEYKEIKRILETVEQRQKKGLDSFRDFHNFKVDIGNRTNYDKTAKGKINDIRKEIYRMVNDEVDLSIYQASNEYLDLKGISDRFLQAKANYAAATETARLTNIESAKRAGNKIIGLTDQISGVKWSGIGLGTGLAFGSQDDEYGWLYPAIFAAGGFGMKKAFESTWFKTAYARKAKDITSFGATNLIKKAFENSSEKIEEISKAALNLSEVPKNAVKLGAYKATSEFLNKDISSVKKSDRIETIKELNQKLDEYGQQIRTNTLNSDALAYSGAPNVAAQFAEKQIQVLDYLKSTLPQTDQSYSLFGGKKAPEITDQDLHKFEKSLRIINNPYSILNSIYTNTITQDEVDALSAIYPNIFNAMRERITQVANDKQPKLSFSDRMRLSILLGTPLDPSIGSVARYQNSFGGQSQTNQQSQPVSKASSLNIVTSKSNPLSTPVTDLMFKNK